MATYRNSDEALMERVRRYIKGLGYYAKPPGGIPASDLAGWVLPSAVTDKAVGGLGYTKNEGTVTGAKVNNVMIEDEDGVLDIGTVVTDVSGKADIDSPTFTGTPKAPTPSVGTNNTQIATTAFVTTAVADAIAGVTGIEYTIVASLPATGEAGVIYLIANSGSGQNIYDEYIWVNNAFEKIGTTEIDLSGYSTTAEIEEMLDDKQDVISDLSDIRSGAELGATAVQTETDPTVPAWAKASSKPSYSYSEITNTPTLASVATSGSYNDLSDKPTIPAEQIQADWNQSNSSAKDYIKNKPTIPVVPTLADVATSGDYGDLINKPTIPTVPTNVSAFTNDAGYLTQHQDISGKANSNDLATVAFSGSYTDLDDKPTIPTVPTNVSAFTNDAGYITTETEPDFNNSAAASITSTDITAWNGKSTFSGSYNDLTDKPTLFSGAYADLTGKPNFAAVATSGDYDDLTNKPTIPAAVTESTVSGWGFTKNAGTITGITMNGASKGTSGVVDLGTVITSHQDISGKANTADLAAVATSGSYTDLSDKPTIPSVPTALSSFTDDLGSSPTHTHSQYLTSAPVTSVNGQTGAVSLSIPDVSGKEDTSNKVTSLSSSSTDTQYPSAKCVYDLIGDIETLLAAI